MTGDNEHVAALKAELRAIQQIDRVLAELSDSVRRRVVVYLADRYGEDNP